MSAYCDGCRVFSTDVIGDECPSDTWQSGAYPGDVPVLIDSESSIFASVLGSSASAALPPTEFAEWTFIHVNQMRCAEKHASPLPPLLVSVESYARLQQYLVACTAGKQCRTRQRLSTQPCCSLRWRFMIMDVCVEDSAGSSILKSCFLEAIWF